MLGFGLNHGLVVDLDLVLDPRVESGFVFDHDFDFNLWFGGFFKLESKLVLVLVFAS